MNIEIHGTGRAAGALGLRAVSSGHRITAVYGRSEDRVAELEDRLGVTGDHPDLRIIAVSDDAIESVVEGLVGAGAVPTVHVSGSMPVSILNALADRMPTGSFHPLQTLPDMDRGAARLEGAWVAVTATEPFAVDLDRFAESLGCRAFRLEDSDKAVYHAAAAACANYVLVALGLGETLFTAAGVRFDAARPLVEAIVANAFTIGPSIALTGPIARGDVGTVRRQLAAAEGIDEATASIFRSMARATATFAGSSDDMVDAIG
ncbi:MAG TPA: DUF2520 domain-containing protein [Acidimicrobiia bacterium]|nr:DUF2520 domain-containing protein [Acidimicrobiia bacterium]